MKLIKPKLLWLALISAFSLLALAPLHATTIEPVNKYAYGANMPQKT
jgi:hypothetical protein